MTPENYHFLITMGFFAFLVAAIAVTSVLNTRARRKAEVGTAQARAREAYWRAQGPEGVPGQDPASSQDPGDTDRPDGQQPS